MLRIILLGFLIVISTSWGTIPSPVIDSTKLYVYEVVVKKLEDSQIKYPFKLPIHLIPYDQRVDQYRSIGSAFYLAGIGFVSAAHVFDLHQLSHQNEFYIRDHQKNVYPITQVKTYSAYQDVIIFEVDGVTLKKGLLLAEDPEYYQKVFSVGNALGEGVIIREGLLTSKTSEVKSGEWKWLRFSAPVSPGNSGGPLLDQHGKVLGVISKKSPNENLNYALPMAEALSINSRYAYDVRDVLITFSTINLIGEIPYQNKTKLPSSTKQIQQDFYQKFLKFYIEKKKRSLKDHHNIIFPKGKGVDKIKYSVNSKVLPVLIAQNLDDEWKTIIPNFIRKQTKRYGDIYLGNYDFFQIVVYRKLFNEKVKDLINKPQEMMDRILETGVVKRSIMNQQIRVASLGHPKVQNVNQDDYGRKWFVFQWDKKHSDSHVYLIVLPSPSGFVALVAELPGKESEKLYDLLSLRTYLLVNHFGHLSEWKQFLQDRFLCGKIFNDVSLRFGNDEGELKSHFATVKLNKKWIDVSDKTMLMIDFGFNQSNQYLSRQIRFTNDEQVEFVVGFKEKPEEDSSVSLWQDWNELVRDNRHLLNSSKKVARRAFYWNTLGLPEHKKSIKDAFVSSVKITYEGYYD